MDDGFGGITQFDTSGNMTHWTPDGTGPGNLSTNDIYGDHYAATPNDFGGYDTNIMPNPPVSEPRTYVEPYHGTATAPLPAPSYAAPEPVETAPTQTDNSAWDALAAEATGSPRAKHKTRTASRARAPHDSIDDLPISNYEKCYRRQGDRLAECDANPQWDGK
jgi:hypothetical protein